ncbi:MAG: PEPxxWA-CTERM sorting domain-containing protein [Proteobacteria bacterium]|nr:PEPxxWA-CTERM sorting domain-containing protein [Pseudomonadota bacterium]
MGFTSTEAVAKVSISESGAPGATGCCIYDNEYFGDYRFLSATGVPEPAAWAMMVAGFVGAGAMLRRRRVLPA